MSRILLTGINGQVGWELQRSLQPLGEVFAFDRGGFDLANPDGMRAVLHEIKPDIIVNPAAYTAVDKAENETARATAINATAPGILAEAAKQQDALLIHYSTDYVFDGKKSAAYGEDDPVCPINAYGRGKLAGEQAIQAADCRHLIFRCSWVYGLRGQNFLRTMLRLARERDELRIVADQIGAPTWCRMIAETTALAIARYAGQQGIYHLAAAGATSWHGFAAAIIADAAERGLLQRTPAVRRITSADFPTPARRPANSRLNCDRLQKDFTLQQPDWASELQLCLDSALPAQ
ncbi:MAG: dTDP-4-dehydrorhamnose reductase [Rhodocyclaceae bacterium]|nr:dTDP-4-dehydrorhamnose reductase [Rhodocyclaceae bacterium]MDP1957496.1 dTDP-4-dehydrorhamnose reductase [Rhodocyclaceae bacterium]